MVEGDERGCTLTALRISHDQATIVHIGDSRAYRVRSGVAELLTRDHNLRSELLAAGIVPGSTSSFGPLRALTSYLGKSHDDLEVDVRSVSLRAGDRLVLCTDGVFGGLRHSELVGRAFGGTATEAAERLTATQASDDATVIVIDVNADGGRA
jgi:serine/threonine protein phosphatase PrpC